MWAHKSSGAFSRGGGGAVVGLWGADSLTGAGRDPRREGRRRRRAANKHAADGASVGMDL